MPSARREISRFPRREHPHMPGSPTTPGRAGTRDIAPVRVAFRNENSVGTRSNSSFAAQWLAYARPYRRFATALADDDARLGADADRYSFIVVDLHHLLPAGLPAHSHRTVARRNACLLGGEGLVPDVLIGEQDPLASAR
jgi:hypothetical protein